MRLIPPLNLSNQYFKELVLKFARLSGLSCNWLGPHHVRKTLATAYFDNFKHTFHTPYQSIPLS